MAGSRVDRRVKAPGLMSRAEFADHCERFHGDGTLSRWAHKHEHHVVRTNHGHRPMLLSQVDHPDWAQVAR